MSRKRTKKEADLNRAALVHLLLKSWCPLRITESCLFMSMLRRRRVPTALALIVLGPRPSTCQSNSQTAEARSYHHWGQTEGWGWPAGCQTCGGWKERLIIKSITFSNFGVALVNWLWNKEWNKHFQWLYTCSQKRFSILGICPGTRPWFLLLPKCTDSGSMFSQTKHGRFFEKMSFSQPRGPPEKVGGHIFM